MFMDLIDQFFPIPLYIADFSGMSEINDALCSALLKFEQNHKTAGDDNWGGIANVYASFNIDAALHKQDYMKPLVAALQPAIQRFCSMVELDQSTKKLEIHESWFNVSRHGSFQEYHCHAGCGPFCGIYYVKAPENSGNTVFRASFPAMRPYYESRNENNPFYRYRKTVISKTGRFAMFPSWLDHCVTMNKSNEPRITIAFNFKH